MENLAEIQPIPQLLRHAKTGVLAKSTAARP